MNASTEAFANKISAEMLSACYNRIDDQTVRGIFSNLTIVDVEWHDQYDKFVKIDYSKVRSVTGQADVELTPEQHILFYKVQKAREEFMSLNRVKTEKSSKTSTLFGIDITKIRGEFKLFYILAIFGFFIFGTIYLMSKLKKSTDKSKKKKKQN